MTFKEELDAQRKRLEEAQKRYFASQPKMEKERAAHHGGDPEPKLIRPDFVSFSRSGAGDGTSMAAPRVACDIARYGREKFYGGGKVQGESSSQPALGEEADAEGVREIEAGFTIQLTIVPAQSRVSSHAPPINAEFILHLLLRHDEHDALIGDLIERYGKKCARLGVRRAKLWFYAEILWTALPLLKRVLVKASGLVAFGEWVRRHVL
jgi:hypothetical protein